MARFAATLAVVILSGLGDSAALSKDACDLYAAVGQSLNLTFVYEGLTMAHVLRWTHNATIIFYRQQGRVSVGRKEDISATGSLMLRDLKHSSAGAYLANVLHPNGTFARGWSRRLCVMDKVAKPRLTYACDPKSAVNLKCNVAGPQGLAFSWTLDDRTLPSETRQTLSVSLAQLKGERRFRCDAANRVSRESSDTVRPACATPPPPPPLVCFKSKTVVAALAGGTSLILTLLAVVVVLCCRYRRQKQHAGPKQIGGHTMLSLSKKDSVIQDYETMHPTGDPGPPCPEASPRGCYQKPGAEGGDRPLEAPAAGDTKQPSPVPKPRTKGPQASSN